MAGRLPNATGRSDNTNLVHTLIKSQVQHGRQVVHKSCHFPPHTLIPWEAAQLPLAAHRIGVSCLFIPILPDLFLLFTPLSLEATSAIPRQF